MTLISRMTVLSARLSSLHSRFGDPRFTGELRGFIAVTVVQVVLGTTLGMMLANVPAVFLGDKIAKKVSMQLVHGIAAAIFAILGLLTLFNVGKLF